MRRQASVSPDVALVVVVKRNAFEYREPAPSAHVDGERVRGREVADADRGHFVGGSLHDAVLHVERPEADARERPVRRSQRIAELEQQPIFEVDEHDAIAAGAGKPTAQDGAEPADSLTAREVGEEHGGDPGAGGARRGNVCRGPRVHPVQAEREHSAASRTIAARFDRGGGAGRDR